MRTRSFAFGGSSKLLGAEVESGIPPTNSPSPQLKVSMVCVPTTTLPSASTTITDDECVPGSAPAASAFTWSAATRAAICVAAFVMSGSPVAPRITSSRSKSSGSSRVARWTWRSVSRDAADLDGGGAALPPRRISSASSVTSIFAPPCPAP